MKTLAKAIKEALKAAARRAAWKGFISLDRLGVHCLPKSYYSPVCDFAWLRRHTSWWCKPWEAMPAWDLDRQLAWLASICDRYLDEVRGLQEYKRIQALEKWGYGPIESQVLHCFVRAYKPRRILEIGGGASTFIMAMASKLNVKDGAAPPEIICVEPFPRPTLKQLEGIRLLEQPCQSLPLEIFTGLVEGDLLFIDSTHTVKTGSDVVLLCCNVLPNLSPGVMIQIHDINLPYLYPRDALLNFYNCQETAMVAALLVENRRLDVLACMSALHYYRKAQLRGLLPDYVPQEDNFGLRASHPERGHFPSSLWLRVVRSG